MALIEFTSEELQQLRQLVQWLRDHDTLMIRTQVLHTPGCQGDFGCCSKHLDLTFLDNIIEKAVE